ncbi:hypothetical protein Rhopal_004123-T1 [Rhodotorula paludigena]|uniref:Uncharacterized protein n=1 Tax=Rhodotorula paludigena TaxID=86838 RepID=A0AAV5GMI7_9BASI|nr:hypothetical protein Rhopal_004123-T1 [Rhodotorula paludigena]
MAKSLLARAWHDLADGTNNDPPVLIPRDNILRYCCYIVDETHYSARFKEQLPVEIGKRYPSAAAPLEARHLYERPSWRAPNTHSRLYRKVSSSHGIKQAKRPIPFGEVDVILLTTFPVGGGGSSILEHEKSRSGFFCLASTAEKIRILQQEALPTVSNCLLWLDSNPTPRPAGKGTNASDKAQKLAFDLTANMLDKIPAPFIFVAQAANCFWTIQTLVLSHTRNNAPIVTLQLFQDDASIWDRFWYWQRDEFELAPTN